MLECWNGGLESLEGLEGLEGLGGLESLEGLEFRVGSLELGVLSSLPLTTNR